jgi:hypothetical protein
MATASHAVVTWIRVTATAMGPTHILVTASTPTGVDQQERFGHRPSNVKVVRNAPSSVPRKTPVK